MSSADMHPARSPARTARRGATSPKMLPMRQCSDERRNGCRCQDQEHYGLIGNIVQCSIGQGKAAGNESEKMGLRHVQSRTASRSRTSLPC
jgi:hypothetical protein